MTKRLSEFWSDLGITEKRVVRKRVNLYEEEDDGRETGKG